MERNFWGSLITQLRKGKGVPQRRLAKLADINRNSLSFIESGKQPPTIYVVERLLGCLGYELDAIELPESRASPENTPCISTDKG